MTCFACGGYYHPSSGHLFREFGVVYCGPCYRGFVEWMRRHMRRRWGGHDFYQEAAQGIWAVKTPEETTDPNRHEER